jgi:hypothetical protein
MKAAIWTTMTLLAAHAAWGAEPPKTLQVRLFNAVFGGPQPTPDGPSLILTLTRDGDRWERVFGVSGHTRGAAWGYVAESSVADDALALGLDINVESDPWMKGGRGQYRVTLKRAAGGPFEGRYAGTLRGVAVEGAADAEWLPPRPTPAPDFTPVKPGEHPRILFRKTDLPSLREKAATPFGQAALEKMTDGIGLGIRYQLSGDRAFADQARAFVERLLDGDYKAVTAPGSHHGMYHWGPVWEQAGVAYDLCYDAWPPAFRTRVETFILLWTYRILYQHTMFNMQAMYDYGNYEAGWFYYGPALACLALWGEKGAEPPKPFAPDPVESIPPAAGYTPGRDVPTVPLEPGKSPAKWLAAPPLDALYEGDPLAEIGGLAACRPESGVAFTVAGVRRVFEPLDPQFVPPSGGVILNIGKSLSLGHVKRQPGPEIKKDGPLTMVLYTVLDNAEPRGLKVHAPFTRWGGTQMIVNGHILAHGQVVKMDKGLYPLTVVFRIRPRWDWMDPKLLPATEADVAGSAALLADLRAQYEASLRDWEHDVAEWRLNQGASQEFQKAFELTRWVMFTHYREGMGSGGMQSSTFGSCASVGLLPATYAAAHRRAFGVDVSPCPDITHYVPRRLMACAYPPDGPPAAQDINGPSETDPALFACNYPIVPEPWKPAVLWAWQRQAGVTGPGDAARVLVGPVASAIHRAFLDYPLDPASGRTRIDPRPPKGILPLTWSAPDYGYYVFRNGWEGKDDFVAQIYAKTRQGHGYTLPNAGTFTLMGLGHTWVEALPGLRLHNQRSFNNVVLLPDNDTHESACGRVTHVTTQDDGSGVVTIDLADLYAAPCRDAKGTAALPYEKYGNIRRASLFQDSGIAGARSFAADYSGKCGSPCLFAVADAITGGKAKIWKCVVSSNDLARAKVDANTVTIAKPDGASMRMTFLSPPRAQVKAEMRAIAFQQTYNRGEAQMPSPGIYVQGADPADGRFLAVCTVQRGEPPAIKIEGEGLAARAQIGGRIVRFDGRNLILEELPAPDPILGR